MSLFKEEIVFWCEYRQAVIRGWTKGNTVPQPVWDGKRWISSTTAGFLEVFFADEKWVMRQLYISPRVILDRFAVVDSQ